MSDTAVHDPRPKSMDPSVVKACQASIVLAAGLSITLNVYQHLHGHDLNPGIAWVVGTFVPVLVALLSHVAAHVKSGWFVKVLVFGISGLLMYVSASAGTTVLTPALHFGPALATSAGADLAALTMLGFLMHAADLKAALDAWEEREAERRRQAEYEALSARFGRPGNGRGNALGNSRGNAGGNAVKAAEGNAPALQPGNAGRTALPSAVVVAGTAETVQGDRATGPMATVTDLPRRASMSDDEMWTLAVKLADERERVGLELTVRAFMEEYGGTPKRVAPLVKKVKEARAGSGGGQAAAGE